MRVLVIACGLALVLSSCVTSRTALYFDKPATGKRTIQHYKYPVEANLVDPESSRYRNIKYYSPKRKGRKITVMCGNHNSKSTHGGYTGYKRFVSDGVRSDRDHHRTYVTPTTSIVGQGDETVECLCRNGDVPTKCTGDGSIGAHCVAWLLFIYGGGWLWAKCY